MADNFTQDNLRRLSDADLAVAENEPDVRGWTVVSGDGRTLGDVEDLIVDTGAMKVQYLELDSDSDAGDDAPIYIPVANVDVDRENRRVIVRGGDARSMRGWAPEGVAQQFAGSAEQREARRLTRAEEEVRIGKRAVEAGEVRVGKHVETERVHQEVGVMREDVRIDRRPVTDAHATGEIRASGDEIRVPVIEEEVVVEKRPVVKEELVISKEQVQETRPVDVEVRKEEFDIKDDRRSTRKGGM